MRDLEARVKGCETTNENQDKKLSDHENRIQRLENLNLEKLLKDMAARMQSLEQMVADLGSNMGSGGNVSGDIDAA